MKTVVLILMLLGCHFSLAKDAVTYEAFGALGDGVNDDLPAICKAHEYANKNGLPVRSDPDATYHLGRRDVTAYIATDTDWGTSRFIVDDADVENHKRSVFEVRSLLKPVQVKISQLERDQKKLEIRLESDCFVTVENKHQRRYIRRGLNQNSGSVQRDSFILRKDGSIDSPIDWDYDQITKITARPIDGQTLFLRGGEFATIANRMEQPEGYNYWHRNIKIRRSNTVVEGLKHYITGETDVGHPYSGFINVADCANITLRDCFATGHKTYKTIGSAGKPVNMGSYDYSMNNVVGLKLIRCTMDNIMDRSLWGVIGSNFCKDILLEDCVLSRMDVHQGVSGGYTIRGCTLGHMGLNAVGRGLLTVENSTIHGRELVNFRSDYGSSWNGDLVIRNCRWIPRASNGGKLYVFGMRNDGMHDFGYPCSMPRNILIDNLMVEDAEIKYDGLYYFPNPDGGAKKLSDERPFPYAVTKSLSAKNVEVDSGKAIRVSPHAVVQETVVLKEK